MLAKTVAHFWPDLRGWLDALRDPRDPNRIVYPARCLGWTGLLVFVLKLGSRRRHCPHCLERTVGGQTQYFHHVLEAKLVTPDGLAISIGTEFIENADPGATKQDCELKGFVRLAERLHRDFPQLRLCLLLDALYANGPVFDLCRQYHWKYIITFKEGGLPALWTEYEALRDLQPQNRRTETPAEGVRQTFAWVSDLPYTDTEGRSFRLGALQCQEEGPKGNGVFAWLTNFPVEPNTVAALANRGGRPRWKIENEGFNTQKNGGFDLEHAYGTGPWAIKNFYLLMQLAHLVLQLVERGTLLVDRCETLFGSLRALARRLAESLRNHPLDADALDIAAAARIQIRLRAPDTS